MNVANDTYNSGVWSRSDVRQRATVLNKIAVKLRENIPRLAKLEVAQTGRAIRYVLCSTRCVCAVLIQGVCQRDERTASSSPRGTHTYWRYCLYYANSASCASCRPSAAPAAQWFEYFAALIRTHEGTVPPFLGSYVNYGETTSPLLHIVVPVGA